MRYFMNTFCALTIFSLPFVFATCSQESDICTEMGTPKMKMKFKKQDKLFTVDNLTIGVLMPEGDTLKVLTNARNVDSVLVPMKINGDIFTDIIVKIEESDYSKIHIEYNEKLEYVSPGCGMRKLYNNISATVHDGPVKDIEINSKQVHDENTTAIYLVF